MRAPQKFHLGPGVTPLLARCCRVWLNASLGAASLCAFMLLRGWRWGVGGVYSRRLVSDAAGRTSQPCQCPRCRLAQGRCPATHQSPSRAPQELRDLVLRPFRLTYGGLRQAW